MIKCDSEEKSNNCEMQIVCAVQSDLLHPRDSKLFCAILKLRVENKIAAIANAFSNGLFC